MTWYQRAAESGSPQAQFYLGLMHETGTNRPVAPVEAARWFAKAARQGHALAQYKFAAALHLGKGIAADLGVRDRRRCHNIAFLTLPCPRPQFPLHAYHHLWGAALGQRLG